jgi:hypothetical protein
VGGGRAVQVLGMVVGQYRCWGWWSGSTGAGDGGRAVQVLGMEPADPAMALVSYGQGYGAEAGHRLVAASCRPACLCVVHGCGKLWCSLPGSWVHWYAAILYPTVSAAQPPPPVRSRSAA